MRSIEEIRDAFIETLDTSKPSQDNIAIVDTAIDELSVARDRITLLQIQTTQCRRILLNIRKIAAFIPGDIGAKFIEAMAPIDEIEANERKIEALAKREATE